ncbi:MULTISPECIES: mercury methylation ferredoxin HgcB [unclassified Dehalobacter]|uniref:mercury methylation ferredoxin HgcB n=1 Tax=unclassified Dehalobacter TaxID=2635733 RepID=UPI00028A76AC|nr:MULTISPECIES: mercury methylation ferredoxin HgcB [unclassified Dehalobacter]AFV02118.1 Ferredoxin [Dehalobacter sp. DCA]AFV05174.1 Ferredoxin [Dehalobacter sp. CF]
MKHRYLKNVSTLTLKYEKCTGCGRCLEVCPHQVLGLKCKKAEILDIDLCMECGACARNCPFNAIDVKSGVGCASAVITGWLTGTEPSCDCSGGNSGGCC